jgi:hypothetical protein
MAKRTAQRGTPRASARQRRKRQQQWIIIGVAVVVVIIGAGLVYASLSRDEVGQQFTDQGNRHLAESPASYIWNSRPPTSGPHAGNIASWGEHAETVPEWFQVHNLEDGGVIIHYNCPEGCPETVAALRAIMDDYGTEQLLLHPYANMESTIALTAWTRVLTLDAVDGGKIRAFIEAYRGIDHHRS